MPTTFVDNLINGQLTQASHLNQYGFPIQALESGESYYEEASGATNAYEVTFPARLVIDAYTAGMLINFLANDTNTGPTQLKVNALAFQEIVKNGGDPLDGGEINAGQIVAVIHDGTRFHLVGAGGAVPAGVTSFNGRSGAVLPVSGDYSMADMSGVAFPAQGGTGHDEYQRGDLLVASGATVLERLPVGADGEVLTADSSQPTGLKWAAPPDLVPPPYVRAAYTVVLGDGTPGGDTSNGTLVPTACPESDPPILGIIGNAYTRVYFFYRVNNRWRPVCAGGIGVETAGSACFSMRGPQDTSPSWMIYVPQGGSGPGRGKFWIGSQTNEYIRVVDPADLSFQDYALNAADAKTGPMVFSPDLNRVYAIAGDRTRVVKIDADNVTVDSTATGFTNLSSLCLQIDGGVTGKVWATRTSGGFQPLEWLHPSTLAVTSTGFAPGWAQGAMVYMPELGALFVSATNNASQFAIVLATAPYTTLLSSGTAEATRCARLAYLPEVGMVVRADQNTVFGIDRATGTKVASVDFREWSQANFIQDVTYEPAFREFYLAHANGPHLFVGI